LKILHTADWHLGKYLYQQSLFDDQKHIIQQIKEKIFNEQPDVVIIAGDIYDRIHPSAEAIRLFDETIKEIVLDHKIPVIAIAGNHDSAERTQCFNNLLKWQGFHIFGKLTLPIEPVILEDTLGEVYFYPIPFIEPNLLEFVIKDSLNVDVKIETHQQAMDWIVADIKKTHPDGKRAVFIGHLYVNGGEESDSERKLSIGGSSMVDATTFDFFDYTALGHLHGFQTFLDNKVCYCSSILKYSFSEAYHDKGLVLFDLEKEGIKNFKHIPLIPRRDLLIVEGEIINHEFMISEETFKYPQEGDFLEVHLANEEFVVNVMEIIRQKYPNAMFPKYPNLYQGTTDSRKRTVESMENKSPLDLFKEFYTECVNQDLDQAKLEIMQEVIKEATHKNI